MEDPKKAFSVDYIYIEKDSKVEKITIADIVTISYPIKNNTISVINWDTS